MFGKLKFPNTSTKEKLMIEAVDLCAGYKNNLILKNLSFTLKDKGLTVLLGANGSGKSTLLSLIAGVPNSSLECRNEPLIDGQKISTFSSYERAQKIAFTAQNETCAWAYSVNEYVAMGRFAKEEDSQIVAWALKSLALEALADRAVTELSGGEFARAAIARSLVQDTPYLLLDEPQANLDIQHQYALFNLLEEIAKTKSILVTMHDINMAALFAENILLLKSGTLIAEGSPEKVITAENIQKAYSINVQLMEHPIRKKVQIYL